MEVVQIPPLYGPTLEFVWSLRNAHTFWIDGEQPFQRATLCSRMHILGSNSVISLSIPVLKHPKGAPLREICIDYHQKWQDQHWRSLVSCYNRSPYFEYFRSDLEALFYARTENLLAFLRPITQWLLSQYFPKKTISDNLAEIQGQIQPLNPVLVSQPQKFSSELPMVTYTQVFGQNFVKNLSIWDALFCIGPNFGNTKTE